MSPLKVLFSLLALFSLASANIGEITLIKGDARVIRLVAPPEAQPIEINATATMQSDDANLSDQNVSDRNATDQNASLPAPQETPLDLADQNQSETNATVAAPIPQEINATVGMALQEKDVVRTLGKGSQVRITMSDGTLITLGGMSEFTIEAFSAEDPQASLSLAAGTLRTLTGQIGKVAPDRFKLKAKTATIGIRGTDFVTALGAEGAVDAACLDGAIGVATEMGEVTVPAGQMTTALSGAAPAAPVALTAAMLGTLFEALSFDEDEAAEAIERFTPLPETEENNETNATQIIVPEEENLTVIRAVSGTLLSAASSVALDREADQPVFSDENRTLLEGDRLVFEQAGRLALNNQSEIAAGAQSRIGFPINDENGTALPLTLESGAFLLSGAHQLAMLNLLEGAKALLILAPEQPAIVVSLEGTVTVDGAEISNLMLQEGQNPAREYEAEELIGFFKAVGLGEAEAKPYLPKPKAPPKPKIYKF